MMAKTMRMPGLYLSGLEPGWKPAKSLAFVQPAYRV